MSKRTYYAIVSGFINGAMRRAGDPVGAMTADQAKYLVMSGLVTTEAPKAKRKSAEPGPMSLGKKTR